MPERIGVVVVHYGNEQPTRECVASVEADPSHVDRQVVVVDNLGNLTASAVEPARILRCPENPGFGGGANRGIETLADQAFDAFVVLNHDVTIRGGFLAAALAALAEPRAGAAGGPLFLDQELKHVWYAGGEVSLLTGTARQSRSARSVRQARDVGFLPGAALALEPAAWREVGGFDPTFFLYSEDVDLCLRLRRHGFRLRYEPGMVAVHHLGAATGSAARSPLYLEHLTRTRLRPFAPLALRLYLAFLHTGYVALRAAWHAPRGRTGRLAARALLRGHLDALRAIARPPLR